MPDGAAGPSVRTCEPTAQRGASLGVRYRTGGRESKRVQIGGFGSEQDARAALERALEKLRRTSRSGRSLTLAEFVDEYLAQHEVAPVTLEKLRFLLTRAVQAFGGAYLDELTGSGRDLGVADDGPPWLPLRRNPGAPAGARQSGRLEDARQ